MRKITSIIAIAITASIFTGCATINDGIVDGIAYTTHSIVGIDYPQKTGKIYVEAIDLGRCDISPILINLLEEYDWTITSKKEEADCHVYTHVSSCPEAQEVYKKDNHLAPQGIGIGASTMQYSSTGGVAIMLAGLLMGGVPEKRTPLGVSVTVHNPSDDSGRSFDLPDSSMNLEYLTDSFASGVFYK